MHFSLRIFDEFFSGFRAKFQNIVTCVAFSIKFAKTNQKFAEILNFVKKITIIQNYSLVSLMLSSPRARTQEQGEARRDAEAEERQVERRSDRGREVNPVPSPGCSRGRTQSVCCLARLN